MRRTLLAIAAVLLATIGTTLLYLYVSAADNRAQHGVETVEVLVASSDMDPGTTASALQVERRKVPQFGVIPQAISGTGPVQGQVLTVRVFAGQQLSARMFGAAAAGGLAPDHRAISVQLPEADRVAGMLRPGSVVDVYRLAQNGAKLIIPKARVINVDLRGNVTFDLDQDRAAQLLDGNAQGRLVLDIVGS
jgi:pilus assembly protein CpaB